VIDRSKVPNAFEFVTVAGARARQLLRGCTPKVDEPSAKKARVALREVANGAVQPIEREADAAQAPAR
jgi:DNA-directed RNA polymerase omega subunit